MNTKIYYLYRDAENYKSYNEQVVKGTLTKEQVKSIIDHCDAYAYFIPSQVGLPEKRFATLDPSIDHVWFEIDAESFCPTEEAPTIKLSAKQLYENFCHVQSWDEISAWKALGQQ